MATGPPDWAGRCSTTDLEMAEFLVGRNLRSGPRVRAGPRLALGAAMVHSLLDATSHGLAAGLAAGSFCMGRCFMALAGLAALKRVCQSLPIRAGPK